MATHLGTVSFTIKNVLVFNVWMTEWRTKFRREMNDKENKMGAIGTDSLINYETVKYFGNEDFEVKRYRNSIVEYVAFITKN